MIANTKLQLIARYTYKIEQTYIRRMHCKLPQILNGHG
jgi:hypothetical protein